MGQARLRVMIVSERTRRSGSSGERRTTLRLVPRWADAARARTVAAAASPPVSSGHSRG